MKKTAAILAALLMALSVTMSAFAAGAFVSSPSRNEAPEVVSSENESEDCEGEVVVTPYSERHTLPDDVREAMEQAYDDFLNNTDLTELCEELEKLAEELGIDPSALAISDLFDINYTGCDDHDDHGHFDVVLKPETLEGFVGLLHLDGGVWYLVDSAEVTGDGTHLEFDVDSFGPYAIVVNTSNPPQTSDNTNLTFYLIVMVASALTAVVFWRLSKKQKA